MKKVLGVHYILDVYDADPLLLDNVSLLEEILSKIVTLSEMTVLFSASHKFEPQGASSIKLIAESHISIHTFPEYKAATIDIYSCGNPNKVEKAVQYIKEIFPTMIIHKLDRGVVDV